MNKKLLKSAIIMAAMVLFVPTMATAQVTIGGGEPPRATLDVRAMQGNTDLPQGIIPPQLTYAELLSMQGNYISITGRPGAQLNGAIVFVSCVAARPVGAVPPIMEFVTAPGLYLFDYGTGNDTRRWRPIMPPTPYMIVTMIDGANTANLINAALQLHDRVYVSLYGSGIANPTPDDIVLINGLRKGQTITVANRSAGFAPFYFRGLNQTANTGTGTRQTSVAGNRGAHFIWVPGVPGTNCPGHWMYVL